MLMDHYFQGLLVTLNKRKPITNGSLGIQKIYKSRLLTKAVFLWLVIRRNWKTLHNYGNMFGNNSLYNCPLTGTNCIEVFINSQIWLVQFQGTHVCRNEFNTDMKIWKEWLLIPGGGALPYYTDPDRTETNIIFIWSGKVILGEAKPSPNITLPDQIKMILGEVLSNKCFIIPATLCAPGPSHALLIQTKRPFTRYQCAPVQICVLRHLFSNVEFYCIRTGYTVWWNQVSSVSNLMNM